MKIGHRLVAHSGDLSYGKLLMTFPFIYVCITYNLLVTYLVVNLFRKKKSHDDISPVISL